MKTFKESTKTRLNPEASEIVFSIDLKIYLKDIVLKACYAIIDRVYIFLDSPFRGKVDVYLKTKRKVTPKQLENVRDEFLNGLVNASIRKAVSRKNQKMVERIVGGAINAALAKPQPHPRSCGDDEDEDIEKIEREIEALKKELEDSGESAYGKDPLGIRKPAA